MKNKRSFLVILLRSICLFDFDQKFQRRGIFLLLIFAQLLGMSSYASAQQIAVSGTVKDQKGETLIGVTVQIKGTTVAVATDIKGNFSLANLPEIQDKHEVL
jgi:hypothetical protein